MIERAQWRTRILSDIREDARHGRFDTWGRSTVIDENTGTPVIGRELFDELHAAAGIEANYPVGNAGVLHVYGYWFSDELTPYGYKRDRWVDGALATALGLPPDAFHLGGASTLLARVTDEVLPALHNPPADARGTADALLPEALGTSYTQTADARGAADTQLPDAHGTAHTHLPDTHPTRNANLANPHTKTHLHPIPARSRVVILGNGTGDTSALIYGIDYGDGFRLITTFPLAGDPAEVIADFTAHPRYRWNADDPSKTSPEVHLDVDS